MVKKSEILEKVSAPAPRLEAGQQARDILLNFFKDLGWNPETHTVDPNKIKTTKEIYNSLYDAIYEIVPDPIGVGMLLVNRGPSVTENIKPGTVYLLHGWIKEDAN